MDKEPISNPASNAEFWFFFVISLNKLLIKKSDTRDLRLWSQDKEIKSNDATRIEHEAWMSLVYLKMKN